ncbi:MAG: hypothetical protein ACLR1T_03405 [Evtepia gabavorous]
MKLNRKNITLKLDVSSVTSEGEHTLSCKVDFPDTVGDNVSISDWERPACHGDGGETGNQRDSGSRRVHRDGGGQLPGRCGDHRS